MPSRNATTHWEGGLEDGKGQVTFDSSDAGRFPVSFPTRASDDPNGQTSPEELVAAAHSSCYSMQFSAFLAGNGTTATSIDTSADVELGPADGGGFELKRIDLTVEAVVPGIDEETFQQLAAKAKDECPISKALKAVPMTVSATLTS